MTTLPGCNRRLEPSESHSGPAEPAKAIAADIAGLTAFERALLLEYEAGLRARALASQREEIAAAKGRIRAAEVHRLADAGVARAEIARRLGIHRSTVHRMLVQSGRGVQAAKQAH